MFSSSSLQQTVENWSKVFYTSAGVFVATTFVYLFLATAEEQPWGRSVPQAKKDVEKTELK